MPNCCVAGCSNRYKPGSTIKFYRIPSGSREFQLKRRRLWTEAIQQANGSRSEIRTDARICGVHFITGEASTDPERPNFVPTLFTFTKQRQGPSKRTTWASGHQKRHRQKAHVETKTTTTRRKDEEIEDTTTQREDEEPEDTTTQREDEEPEDTTTQREDEEPEDTTTQREDEEPEDTTTQREDAEAEKSPTQTASESPMDHQSSVLIEARDELLPEMQTLLRMSVSKEKETEDKKIHDKDQGVTKCKTEPETMELENKSGLNLSASPQKPSGGVSKPMKMNPVVLLKPLVLPQGSYQVDLSNQTFRAVLPKEQREETDTSQTNLTESHLINKDQPSFPCNMCDRTFTTSHYLKRHKLLHVRDVRKCLRCGVLFCRRHNHVLFQTRTEPLPESEDSSSSSEDELLDSNMNTEKEKTSKVTAIPASPALSNSPLLKTSNLTDIRKPLLVSVKPAAVPSPPSPIPNNQGTVFQIKPLLSDISPALIQPNLPQQPQLPPSLKIFSSQHLTSALLDVQRNYEYILSKPKKVVVKVKEEPEEPVQICPVVQLAEQPIRQVIFEKIAYDLEMVI